MSCIPLDQSSFTPPPSSDTGLSPQLPDLNIPFPPLDMPDLGELFDLLSMILPPGTLKPNFEPDFLNDIYGGIKDILDKFVPFLMLYKFFLPILDLILCIIEIICALLNPLKLIRAVRRLFRQCIPEFLALFPFFALIIMIISLLLLILALIEYIISRIIQLIEIIIKNIITLSRAAKRLENDSIIAIVKKVGDLLCAIQNLFVILGIILVIIQVIKAILSLFFRIPPCDGSDSSSDGCCTPDVCPEFIRNNDTITSNTGNFLYYNEIGIDSGLSLPAGFPPIVSVIRQESWQFYDPNLLQNQAFINITQAFDLPTGTTKVFFPPGTNYTTSTDPNSVPYTINFRFFYEPALFGRSSDPKGNRFLQVQNVIIQNPPSSGVSSFDNTIVAPFNGTLRLIGGTVTEDDGTTPVLINGIAANINTLIHNTINNSGLLVNNGILFPDLSYTFNINHEVLLGAALITLGCIPEVAADRDFINTTISAQFNNNGLKLVGVDGNGGIAALLPDVTATQDCIATAITNFRKNISVESANQFQTDVLNCLNTLQSQTSNALSAAISGGFDQYKSDFELDTEIQFTTRPITVSVLLKESSGQLMTANLPSSVASQLAGNLSGNITLGKLSPFTYDGYSFFNATITSPDPGNGTIQVAFDNNFISILNNPSSIDQTPSVSIKTLTYTFVESPAISDGQPRRDEGDISRE